MIRLIACCAAATALLITAALDASVPPPPPPPPADLPATYDGYSTESLWYAYTYWVRGQTAERRRLAFEALRLPDWSTDETAWRTGLEGPHYVSTSYWIPYGLYFAFEQACPVSSGYSDDTDGCLWRYRSAFFDAAESDINAIVSDTFNGAAFAAYLAGQDVPPEAVSREFVSGFGLEDIVHQRLDSLIRTRDVREDTCPAVREAVDDIAAMSLPLSPYGPPDGTPPPPPPLPPGADHEVLTIPAGFYPDTSVHVVFEGNGTGTMRALVSRLAGPVRACFADTSE
ncbi:hypothetical protein GCM10007420_08560 [Glycocaulis albus]|uniref:Uncharacterized protein n=1 Tax=Glycocaulis albus TaxID=1382801 RepID=A0ABQ1XJL1_9PROT|nr:hypothetical protein [Glycocaulis albus]GGG95300.1 hypothetical protein GCM10007420_08560 [Glycocaulis albus]